MNNADLEKKVKTLVNVNRYKKGYVCAVDILMQLGYLAKNDYKAWRSGRIPYLEKVCKVNLSKLTLINKFISKFSLELGLKSSWTGYNQFGKGVKRRLKFSKSGKKTIEERYATHFIDKKRMIELKEKSQNPAETKN
ncbi:MAG: hypothetical protein ACQETH_10180 [Candidatus Rifleibacteriota bacterium]